MRDLTQPPKLLPGGKEPGKLVVVENVYHVLPQFGTQGTESRYTRWLTSASAWHVDEFEASHEWQPVQKGRIGSVGEMVIENLEGTDLNSVPSEKERESIASLVLQISFLDASEHVDSLRPRCRVLPGESSRLQPEDGQTVYVRCKNPGSAASVRVRTIPA